VVFDEGIFPFAKTQPTESSLVGQNSPTRPAMSSAEVGPAIDYSSADLQYEVDRPSELGSSESPELSFTSEDRGSSNLGLNEPAGGPSSPQDHMDRGITENGHPTAIDSPISEHLGQPQHMDNTQLNSELCTHESRSTRARRPPVHLGDYICYSTRLKDPLSITA